LSVDPEKCKKCGTCVEDCFMKALALADNGIVRNEELCKGCGRCATVCPEKAVSMSISDMEAAIADVQNRIRQRINYE
jgi:UDP-glucose 4-epimerase